jgi:hypothetical protein
MSAYLITDYISQLFQPQSELKFALLCYRPATWNSCTVHYSKILTAHFKEPDRRRVYESGQCRTLLQFRHLTLLCMRQHTAHRRGCWPEGHVTVIVGPQGSWSQGTSVDFHSRDEGRPCECYDVLSVRAEENPASWSSVDIVSQYNEETLDFFTNSYNDSYIIQWRF